MTSSSIGAQQDAERAGELDALREAVRDLIEGSGGITPARQRLNAQPEDTGPGPGYDEQAWRLLGTEMGLAGLGLAEDLGGAGGGLAELTVVATELGRALLPVPFFSSTVLAGQILARCPATGADVLAQVAEGSELAAFAGTDADGCWRPERLPVEANADAEAEAEAGKPSWRLRGTAE
ncbi:MAG TPA: acyl-CoA dehydrogenase family protein, partial [Streptosporangiaceae bacterium]|nr:acyl-CoA dehydrogenase family protein [Streptosporangiaceae bacterium]